MRLRRSAIVSLIGMLGIAPVQGTTVADPGYFPPWCFGSDQDHQRFIERWYGGQLAAMKEPSLWKLARADRAAEVYRLLWLPTVHPAVAVRITV